VNVSDLVRQSAARLAGKPALIFQDRPVSYAGLDEEIDRAAGGFRRLGLKTGDRVALLLQNTPHFVAA